MEAQSPELSQFITNAKTEKGCGVLMDRLGKGQNIIVVNLPVNPGFAFNEHFQGYPDVKCIYLYKVGQILFPCDPKNYSQVYIKLEFLLNKWCFEYVYVPVEFELKRQRRKTTKDSGNKDDTIVEFWLPKSSSQYIYPLIATHYYSITVNQDRKTKMSFCGSVNRDLVDEITINETNIQIGQLLRPLNGPLVDEEVLNMKPEHCIFCEYVTLKARNPNYINIERPTKEQLLDSKLLTEFKYYTLYVLAYDIFQELMIIRNPMDRRSTGQLYSRLIESKEVVSNFPNSRSQCETFQNAPNTAPIRTIYHKRIHSSKAKNALTDILSEEEFLFPKSKVHQTLTINPYNQPSHLRRAGSSDETEKLNNLRGIKDKVSLNQMAHSLNAITLTQERNLNIVGRLQHQNRAQSMPQFASPPQHSIPSPFSQKPLQPQQKLPINSANDNHNNNDNIETSVNKNNDIKKHHNATYGPHVYLTQTASFSDVSTPISNINFVNEDVEIYQNYIFPNDERSKLRSDTAKNDKTQTSKAKPNSNSTEVLPDTMKDPPKVNNRNKTNTQSLIISNNDHKTDKILEEELEKSHSGSNNSIKVNSPSESLEIEAGSSATESTNQVEKVVQ